MARPDRTKTHIGPFLRHIRTGLRMTLRQAANVTHVNFTYLGQVERGEKEPSSEWLSAYIKALGAHAGQSEQDAA